MQVLSRQRGVSLIEVMMAVLIFSIGLIGMAGLLIMATRSNQSAYLRTQVTFLAGNMADRMRANPTGVWQSSYDGTYPTTTAQACTSTSACTPAQLAVHDQKAWSDLMTTFLPPNYAATIKCDKSKAGYDPVGNGKVGMRPPYGGTCKMQIQWSEQGEGDVAHRSTATQTFYWEFQP